MNIIKLFKSAPVLRLLETCFCQYRYLLFKLDHVAGTRKQDIGEPDAPLLWHHVCFSGREMCHIWPFLTSD